MPKLSKLYTVKEINTIRNELIAKHGNSCAICKKPRTAFKKNLSVDHNHRTGVIRGLLCFRCNRFGVGRNSLQSAHALWQYLLQYDPKGG